MRKLLVVVFLISCFTPLFAQAKYRKVALSVSHDGDDRVGTDFAFYLREAIRSSNGYDLAESDKPGDSGPHIHLASVGVIPGKVSAVSVLVVTDIDPSSGCRGMESIVGHEILVVGKDSVSDMGKSVLADVDQMISKLPKQPN